MKYVKVKISRSENTDLYLEVPDDFQLADAMKPGFQETLARAAQEITDDVDWDNYAWWETVECQSAVQVKAIEARKFKFFKVSKNAKRAGS